MRTVSTNTFDVSPLLREPTIREFLDVAGGELPKTGCNARSALVGRRLPGTKFIVRTVPLGTIRTSLVSLYEVSLPIAMLVVLPTTPACQRQLAVPRIVVRYRLTSVVYLLFTLLVERTLHATAVVSLTSRVFVLPLCEITVTLTRIGYVADVLVMLLTVPS